MPLPNFLKSLTNKPPSWTQLPTEGENPYLSGRREWNERYGDYIAQAANWRLAFFVSVAVVALLGVSEAHIAGQAQVKALIVEVDKLGDAVATKFADEATITDARIIRYQLGEAITNAKTVTSDPILQKQMFDRVYAICSPVATEFLDNYYKQHSPFANPRPDPVVVKIRSVLPLSKISWEIQWQEETRPSNGSLGVSTLWRAVVTLKTQTGQTEAQIRANPSGIAIDTIDWTQQL